MKKETIRKKLILGGTCIGLIAFKLLGQLNLGEAFITSTWTNGMPNDLYHNVRCTYVWNSPIENIEGVLRSDKWFRADYDVTFVPDERWIYWALTASNPDGLFSGRVGLKNGSFETRGSIIRYRMDQEKPNIYWRFDAGDK